MSHDADIQIYQQQQQQQHGDYQWKILVDPQEEDINENVATSNARDKNKE